MKKLLAVLFLSVFIASPAFSQQSQTAAEYVAGTISVGFAMITTQGVLDDDIPTLNVRYWFDKRVAAELYGGFAAGDTEDSFIIGGRALAIIQSFRNINVYASVSGAFGTVKYDEEGTNGFFKVAAGAGVEYFVLHNLSVSAEAGIGFFDAANHSKQFGIYADWLPQIGIRYYL